MRMLEVLAIAIAFYMIGFIWRAGGWSLTGRMTKDPGLFAGSCLQHATGSAMDDLCKSVTVLPRRHPRGSPLSPAERSRLYRRRFFLIYLCR